LYVRVFEAGYFWDLKEVKVSFYSDSGAVFDKVMMVAGPENDLSLTAAQRRARSKPPVEEKPVGPTFESRSIHGSKLILKPDAAGGTFERCVPVGMSYLPVGIKDSVEAGEPLKAIAKSDDAFVAIGPKELTGRGRMPFG
ncbi:MAG: hypothetical protein ACRELG_10760, partial [Gemmataceae bacterium]